MHHAPISPVSNTYIHSRTHTYTLTLTHTHTFIHSIISLWRKDTNFRSPKHTRARIDDAYTTYTTYTTYTRPQDHKTEQRTG
jgi:hypothetical protein